MSKIGKESFIHVFKHFSLANTDSFVFSHGVFYILIDPTGAPLSFTQMILRLAEAPATITPLQKK